MENISTQRPTIHTKMPGGGSYHRLYDMVVLSIVALEQAGQHENAVLVMRYWHEGTSIAAVMTYLDKYVYIDLLPD